MPLTPEQHRKWRENAALAACLDLRKAIGELENPEFSEETRAEFAPLIATLNEVQAKLYDLS